MQASQLKPYSIGIAAENKPLDSFILEVTPIEDTPMVDGEINADKNVETVESENQTGTAYQVKMTSSNSVQARWLPMGSSNRRTAPDVRRGESVVLYRFSDSDTFYWTTLKDDMALRKLETVVYAWSGTKDEGADVSGDTFYFLEISTHRKLVHFHTSKANGEPFGYDVQINTDKGFIKFQDDAGNWLILDSSEKQIAFKNTDGAYIDLNKKNLTISVPDTIKMTSKVLIEEIGETITIKAGKSITETTVDHTTKATGTKLEDCGAITEKATGAVNVTAGSAANISGSTAKLKADGPIVIDGDGVKISTGVAIS